MGQISVFNNVRLVFNESGLHVKKQQRPKSKTEIHNLSNFEKLDILETESVIFIDGEQNVFGFVPLVDFDTKKYDESEITCWMGKKFVLRGVRKLSVNQNKRFVFAKPFLIVCEDI